MEGLFGPNFVRICRWEEFMYHPTRGLLRTLLESYFRWRPICFQIGKVGVWQRLAKQTNPKLTVPTGSGKLLETWDEQSEIQTWEHTWSGIVGAGFTAWHVCVVERSRI